MEDSYIIELFDSGSTDAAFNLLVRKYGERLYWHIRRLVSCHEDANDLLQNTYIRVWNALPTFRGDSSLYTWIYRIATNETITFLNRRKLLNIFSLKGEAENAGRNLAADPLFDGDKMQIAVQKAIAKLPPKQKTIFCMRYYEEMKYDQMAEILGTSEGALKASYHHAHNKVIEYLKKNIE